MCAISYKQLTADEFDVIWPKHEDIINEFLYQNDYDMECIKISRDSILSTVVKVDQRRQYFSFFHGLDMSEYKEAALTAFWYIKLSPLSIETSALDNDNEVEKYDSINEKLALYVILKTLRVMLLKHKKSSEQLDKLPKSYIDELVYTFTYRDISKEAMIMLVESMAVFLGLDPYAKKKAGKGTS